MLKSSFVIALALSSALQCNSRFRVAEVEVEAVHYVSNTVSFIDTDGEVWIAEVDDSHKYSVGNCCALVYDTMDTEDIYDDEIVAIAEMEILHN